MTLAGRTLLLTREPAPSAPFIAEAGHRGAAVVCLPTISVTGPSSWDDCDRALEGLDAFDAIAFTSVNGVSWFLRRCAERGVRVDRLRRLKVGAVGAATGEVLTQAGLPPDVVPLHATAHDLAAAFTARGVAGRQVLLPRGDRARPDLAEGLRAAGAVVSAVVVYRTVPAPAGDVDAVWNRLRAGHFCAVCFASPSAADELAVLLGPERTAELPALAAVAAIGPTTAGACLARGWTPAVVARVSTQQGLVEALDEYFGAT